MIDGKLISEFLETTNFDRITMYDLYTKKLLPNDFEKYKDWVIVKHKVTDFGPYGVDIELDITYGIKKFFAKNA